MDSNMKSVMKVIGLYFSALIVLAILTGALINTCAKHIEDGSARQVIIDTGRSIKSVINDIEKDTVD